MTIYNKLQFPVVDWLHLYALHEAIEHHNQLDGKQLSLHGVVRNNPLLNHHDCKITLSFQQSDSPCYERDENQHTILGQLHLKSGQLTARFQVSESIFEEMRKNLVEYSDIEGIHIMVEIGILAQADRLVENSEVNIYTLQYAMRGDA